MFGCKQAHVHCTYIYLVSNVQLAYLLSSHILHQNTLGTKLDCVRVRFEAYTNTAIATIMSQIRLFYGDIVN